MRAVRLGPVAAEQAGDVADVLLGHKVYPADFQRVAPSPGGVGLIG